MTCEGNAAMTVAHVIEHHPDGQRLCPEAKAKHLKTNASL